jgi:hypothetical protein
MSNNSNGRFGKVIVPVVTMAIGICILVGANYLEVKTTNGIRESSVFLSRNPFSAAMNTCDTLKKNFPQKRKILKQYRQDIKQDITWSYERMHS